MPDSTLFNRSVNLVQPAAGTAPATAPVATTTTVAEPTTPVPTTISSQPPLFDAAAVIVIATGLVALLKQLLPSMMSGWMAKASSQTQIDVNMNAAVLSAMQKQTDALIVQNTRLLDILIQSEAEILQKLGSADGSLKTLYENQQQIIRVLSDVQRSSQHQPSTLRLPPASIEGDDY